jgi:hypothetical protein
MRRRAIVSLALLAMASVPSATIQGQGLSVDVSAGHLVYDPVSTVGTNNLVGTLRYDFPRAVWVYGAVAVPLADGSPFWGAAGMGGRFMSSSNRRTSVGADIGTSGFSFRDAVADQIGTGGTLEAMPLLRFSAGRGFVEGRAGWRGHTLSFAGAYQSRAVLETGARAGYGAILRVEGDAHWVRAKEGTFPFIGATTTYDGTHVQVWGETGKWLHDDLDQVTWDAGVAVTLGTRSSVWASVRREAPDPLYWNISRRTWSVGLTQRIGRVASPTSLALRSQAGDVTISVRVTETPSGPVSVAGDFNNWQPAPMQREADRWVVRLSLAPGAYHYAFRSATGDWFVPSSTHGRRDDGMGGHVAVLIVS